MDDTQKMFRTIVNGMSAMKSELMGEIKKLDIKLSGRMDRLDKKIEDLDKKVDDGFEKVNERMDRIGRSVAFLEDDAPTNEEFDELKVRVTNLEQRAVAI